MILKNSYFMYTKSSLDELLHRRKKRQRREREESKRERAINVINDRQMGKMLQSATANIDIGSNAQFPECGNFDDFMPALVSNTGDCSIASSSPAAPRSTSFANVSFYFVISFLIRSMN